MIGHTSQRSYLVAAAVLRCPLVSLVQMSSMVASMLALGACWCGANKHMRCMPTRVDSCQTAFPRGDRERPTVLKAQSANHVSPARDCAIAAASNSSSHSIASSLLLAVLVVAVAVAVEG